jgi:hypothetical protein
MEKKKLKKDSIFVGVLLVIMLIAIMAKRISAESLNVISYDENAYVFVNDTLVSKGSVRNYEIEPGYYQVKLEKNNEVQFSEIVQVKRGIVTTVDTNFFVDAVPVMVNRGAERKEVSRIKGSKGDFGLGFHVANVTSGLSLKYMPGQFGVQLTGWYDQNSNQFVKTAGGRIIYQITDRLASNRLLTLYSAVGYGLNVNEYEGYGGYWRGYQKYRNKRELWEAVLGIEVNAVAFSDMGLFGWTAPGMVSTLLSNFDNAYISFELGFERVLKNNEHEHTGVKMAMGAHFYF